jgi:hypothetical protein
LSRQKFVYGASAIAKIAKIARIEPWATAIFGSSGVLGNR